MKGLGFVGAGNMGEAMIRGILAAKLLPPREVVVLDVRPERARELSKRFGVSVARGMADLFRRCETVVFAVKPQNIGEVLGQVRAGDAKGKLIVTVAAGVPTRAFLSALGEGARVLRAMPNTPAQVGMGSTGLFFAKGVSRKQREWGRKIFSSFGEVAEFSREELLDVVTALSGSGPAYAFLFIEALADGAVRAGMGREEAVRLASATVEGAARMVRETGKHPAELKDMVTSPGGTTAAGIAALETGAFRGTVLSAVFAAWQRCRELSR
ncbi:MAG TPA: pyrroline-5-carboxylate reductase [Candidatus Deferrimicrobiaceae bacterium]|nr:pyrroline-5-carboxylate reductase [Candidatus Deferrimicrobiaceae bacterium]